MSAFCTIVCAFEFLSPTQIQRQYPPSIPVWALTFHYGWVGPPVICFNLPDNARTLHLPAVRWHVLAGGPNLKVPSPATIHWAHVPTGKEFSPQAFFPTRRVRCVAGLRRAFRRSLACRRYQWRAIVILRPAAHRSWVGRTTPLANGRGPSRCGGRSFPFLAGYPISPVSQVVPVIKAGNPRVTHRVRGSPGAAGSSPHLHVLKHAASAAS